MAEPKPPYHWYRTDDHPARNDRDGIPGEVQWNVDFVADTGVTYRIHVGPESRLRMLEMLREDKAKAVPLSWE